MMNTAKKISSAKLFKTILSLVMVLSILVGCSMMFAGCSDSGSGSGEETKAPAGNKHDPAQYEGLNDEEYLQKLGYNNLSDAVAALTDAYDAYKSSLGKSASAGAKGTMTITVGDDILDMLEDAAGGNMKFDFLSKINLDVNVGMKDDLSQVEMGIGLNNKKIATANLLVDMANAAMYLAIPEVNATYVKLGMGAMSGNAYATPGSATSVQGMMAAMAELGEALPSGDQLETIINSYLKVVLEEIDDVERTSVKQELGGLKQDQTQLTVKLYQEDLLNMAKAVLTKAENDDDIKKIIEDVVKGVAEMTGETMDEAEIYGQFRDAVKNALEVVEASRENLDTENYMTITVNTDSVHNVVGFAAELPGSESMGINYVSVTEGDKTAMQLIGKDADTTVFEIAGEGTVKNGKSSGTYAVVVQGEQILTFQTKNLDAKGGTITLKPTEDVLDEITGGTDLPFNDLALEITMAEGELELNVLTGKKVLLGIAVEAKETSVGSIKLPTNFVDSNDSSAMEQWLSNAKFDVLLNNLKKAGVPSDLVDSLGSMLGG